MADDAPSRERLFAALVLVQVFFGGISVAGKYVLPFVPALPLALARLMAAAVVLLVLERLLVRAPLPSGKDLAAFALFALLGVVLNQGLFLSGLARTTATNAVLLIATIPAFTLLVATLLRHERPGGMRVVGLGVSFAGVALLVGRSVDIGWATLLGDLMVVANALSYSIYLVISRPALKRHDPLTVVAWVFALGAVEMAFVAAPGLVAVDWRALPASAWWAFAYVIGAATIVTYGLNTWVLRHLTASRVASFVYLQPLVGVLLAALLLKEAVTPWTVAAGALILAGVAIANRVEPSRRAPAA